MKYKITPYIYGKCEEFANERLSNSYSLYNRRGKSKTDKIRQDILVGTLGEWGAYRYLKELGYCVRKPDMNHYSTRGKSYAADFECLDSGLKFHCKSQSIDSAELYGHSWLVQRNDPVVNLPSQDEWFIFTEVDGKEVTILGAVSSCGLVLGECRVPMFRKTKYAIYLDEQTLEEL